MWTKYVPMKQITMTNKEVGTNQLSKKEDEIELDWSKLSYDASEAVKKIITERDCAIDEKKKALLY